MDAIIRSVAVTGTRQLVRARPRAPDATAAVASHDAVTAIEAVSASGSATAAAPMPLPVSPASPAAPVAAPHMPPVSVPAAAAGALPQPALPAAGGDAGLVQAAVDAALREQTAAMQQLRERLADTEAELANLRAECEAANERDRAQVHEEADRRGHAAGLALGEAEGREQWREQCERITSVAATLVQAKLAVLDDAEDMLVEIAFVALCRVLADKLAERATVATLVAQLVQQEREPELLRVRLHADDIALLQADGDGPRLDPRIRLEADPSIRLGGCAIDSQRGTLDVRLDLQLERLRDALLATRQARRETEEST